MATTPRPNPETVEALLDTTWRLWTAEAAITDSLDRKAATLATFASLLASLIATLGLHVVASHGWTRWLFVSILGMFAASVLLAIAALTLREHAAIGMEDLLRFPMWSEIRRTPEHVRGDTMIALIELISLDRHANKVKAELMRAAFALLAAGLLSLGIEAATLATQGNG